MTQSLRLIYKGKMCHKTPHCYDFTSFSMTMNYIAISLFDHIVQLYYLQRQTWNQSVDMLIFASSSFAAMT